MDPSTHGSEPPKESVMKRFRLAWRGLLIFNFALGEIKPIVVRNIVCDRAYMFANARKKKSESKNTRSPKDKKEELKPAEETPVLLTETTGWFDETDPQVVIQPVKVREPIPEDQQKELFMWMLEEKRKIKPKDRKEKEQIDSDKAILKQFIRSKTLPKFFTSDSSGR